MKFPAFYRLSMFCLLAALAGGLAGEGFGRMRRVRADEPQAAKDATAEKGDSEQPPAKSSSSAEDEEEPPLDAPARKSAPAKQPAPKQPAETTPQESDAPAEPEAPAEQGPVEGEPPLEPGGPVCDIIYSIDRAGKARSFRAALYPDWLEFPVPRNQTFTFRYYNRLATSGSSEAIAGAQLRRIDYYELRMIGLAAEQLDLDPRKLTDPGAAVELSKLTPERTEQAEKVLVTAAAQHESAVQQNRRRGTAWASHVRRPLADALFNLRLGEIDRLIADRQDQEARALCDRTHAELREPQGARRAALRRRYETILLVPAEAAIERRDLKTARDLLDAFRDRYPREPGEATSRINERLKAESKALLQEAQRLAEADRSQALKLVELAGLASPELPEIDALRRQLGLAYPILECGFAELPANFAPPNVLTPVERHASALLFEGLSRWTDDPRTGPHYASQLAEGEPLALARGRQFRLPRTPPAKWSDYTDEQPYFCTSADVSWTIKLLQNKARPGYSSALARVIGGGETDAAEDPFTAVIRLKRDYWQPLSLMGFPILPRHCFPAGGSKEEWAAFNAAPIGSGPYRLGERTDRRVQFVAQAHERAAGRPKIREINFRRFAAEEMVGEILNGRIQLAYGLTAKLVDQLTEQRRHVKTLRPREVWFLA
ncbi:MAG TPA: ABC transporter substrate-binding protein, partial [Pirellulales bacterium]|nr:ABC transporter substrate-binding protein [Pirellulales bacterium]